MSPLFVIPIVLGFGAAMGLFMGYLIQAFDLPPFIITLAGLYLARGLCYVVSIDTIGITNKFWEGAAHAQLKIVGDVFLSPGAIIAIGVVLIGLFMARYTKFGRTIYAIGGSETSAVLMGLPVARTKIAIYAMSGFCSALAGIVFTFYTLSGYALDGKGMELDTIAAVVIGGTLLTGGVGNLFGTVLGVPSDGIIQVLIVFQGTLNSWWTRIVIGFLVFVFCFLQRTFRGEEGGNGRAQRFDGRPPDSGSGAELPLCRSRRPSSGLCAAAHPARKPSGTRVFTTTSSPRGQMVDEQRRRQSSGACGFAHGGHLYVRAAGQKPGFRTPLRGRER